jgi:DNA-directed RNA polymerase II subunit RPB2
MVLCYFAKEALVDKSDMCCVHICNSCGGFAHYTESKQDLLCKACNNTTNISKVIIPYIMKLFSQECLAMGIHMRFRTTKTVPRP